jgi:hypothetical protein
MRLKGYDPDRAADSYEEKELSTTDSGSDDEGAVKRREDEANAMLGKPNPGSLSRLRGFAMLAEDSTRRLPEPRSYTEAMRSSEAPFWEKGKQEEHKSLEKNHTFDIVPLPKGVKPISSRYVFTRKYGADGEVNRHKVRLVARGFQQEEGIDYDETFAAVVKPASYRILFALAAIFGWVAHQSDVKTAFLNSMLDKPVYIRPPKGGMELPPGNVLLVRRALYGLKQSPR